VKLFIGVGGLEGSTVAGVEKFVAQLRSRGYKGLDLETKVLEGIGHSGSKAEGCTRGLQAVFARPSLTLAPGETRIPLCAESDTNFYVKGTYLFIRQEKQESRFAPRVTRTSM